MAPAFPPHPSPASHRVRFLARHGPRFGWSADVLSVRPEFYEESLDPGLEALLPAGLRVTRTAAFRAAWTRRLGVGDVGLRSYPHLRRALGAICRDRPPDVLFIPGGPFYPFLLGAWARARFGVPYVVDYTDPWVHPIPADQRQPWRKAYWHQRLATALEPRVSETASYILSVSDATTDGIRARNPGVPASRFGALPFGFEPLDLETARATGGRPPWTLADGHVHVAYLGAVSTDMVATVAATLEAVRSVRDADPALARTLRVHFVGTSYDPRARDGPVDPLIRAAGLQGVVTESPRRVPYLEALSALCTADVLLALGSSRPHYMASKIFPTLLARRPVVAVFHAAGSVCEVIRAAGVGELVTFDDTAALGSRVEAIGAALRRAIARRDEPSSPPRPEALADFSAERLTGTLCGVFDRVVAEEAAR